MDNIIMSTYYAHRPNPQKTAVRAIPNEYDMMKDWYESMNRNKLNGVIFHDNLSGQFIGTYSNEYIKFYPVKENTDRSINDERFYVYYNYLLNNRDLEWVLMTDLFDVEFQKNPFEYMTDQNKIYVGSESKDVANFSILKTRAEKIYGDISDWWFKVDKDMLNAGIIGGHRDIIIYFLGKMIYEFERINPSFNANMIVLSKCLYDNEIDFVTGYPFHSRYKKFERAGDYYIRHK